MPQVTLIYGTHSWEKPGKTDWWQKNSPLVKFLSERGVTLYQPEYPVKWSGDLEGTFFAKGPDWVSGAAYVSCYFDHFFGKVPLEERNIIAHSHGGQVLAWAAYTGVKFNNVMTFGTPVRKDMEMQYASLRMMCKNWLHVCDSKSDLMAVWGTLFDGRFKVVHENPYATKNCNLPGKIRHSDALVSPDHFHYWESEGWLDFLHS